MTQLENKRALVTGGGNGIGRATCKLLAEHGARVAVADFKTEAAEETVTQIKAAGGEAIALTVDVGDPDQVAAMTAEMVSAFGGVDILFCSAGGGSAADGPVTEMDLDEFWRTIRVDLFGTILCCRNVIPKMVKAGGGSIITMSSLRAILGSEGFDAYTSSKGGIISLTRAMAVTWARHNIRANALAPGMIMTDRIKDLIPPDHPVIQKMLLGAGAPEDVSHLVLYLASDASRLMTGNIIPLDGGASIY